MARIFISHSSQDNDWALRLQDWLTINGWDDVFLDIDPKRGLKAGTKWQQALRAAEDRSGLVLLLVSRAWLQSNWCAAEYLLAKQIGKPCIPLLIEPDVFDDLAPEMTAEHQAVDMVRDPRAYERLQLGLRASNIDPNTFQYDGTRTPYPGFRALVEQDAAIFFGRDAQIVAALNTLRRMRSTGVRRMLVIVGASGSGKSSLLRAGLWPRLERDDRKFLPLQVVRPERAVLSGRAGLDAALERAAIAAARTGSLAPRIPTTKGELRGHLREAGGRGLAEIVDAIGMAREAGLANDRSGVPMVSVVLAIDQIEELWTADAGAEAGEFVDVLSEALERTPRLLVVAAVPSPSYPRLQAEARLAEKRQELFSLTAMPEGSFRAVIEGPAALAGLRLDPALVEEMLRRTSGQDALPLLAFTLERLYREYGTSGNLTLRNYEDLGGTSGAIEAAARNAFTEARARGIGGTDDELTTLLRKVFLPHLVRVDDRGDFIRRIAPVSDIPADARPLVDLLAGEGQRLLVRDRPLPGTSAGLAQASVRDDDIVEVAHEAILREWRLLNAWLIAEREQLVWRQRVDQACRDWIAAPPESRENAVLQGVPLDAARRHVGDWIPALTGNQAEFVRSSLAADDRRKTRAARTQRLLQWGSLAAALIFGALAFELGRALQEARSSEAAMTVSAARLQLEKDPLLAALILNEVKGDSEPRDALDAARDILSAWVPQHQFSVSHGTIGFSGDGRRLASGAEWGFDVWDLETGQLVKGLRVREGGKGREVLVPPSNYTMIFALDEAGQTAMTVHGAGEVLPAVNVWDVAAGTYKPFVPTTAEACPGSGDEKLIALLSAFHPTAVRYAQDDSVLIVYSSGTVVRFSQLGECIRVYPNTASGRHVAFAENETRFAVAYDRKLRVIDVSTGEVNETALMEECTVAAVSSSGERILLRTRDNRPLLWDAVKKAPVDAFDDLLPYVSSAAFSPDGTLIAGEGTPPRSVLGPLYTAAPFALWLDSKGRRRLIRQSGEVFNVAFSPDGVWFAIATAAIAPSFRHVRVWRTATWPEGGSVNDTWKMVSAKLRSATTARLTDEERLQYLGR